MEIVGMMKMATGEGSPLRQGAGTGSRLVFMATEACGGRTYDLGFFSWVSVFIEIFGVGNKLGGSPSHPRGRGRPQGGRARPPPSWMAQDSSGPTLLLRGLLLVHKKSSKMGTSIGLRLVFLFSKIQKQGKNTN